MQCKNCGNELSESTKFCSNCGEKVEREAAAEVAGAVEAEAEKVTEVIEQEAPKAEAAVEAAEAEVTEAADSAAEKLTEAVEQEASKAEAAVETAEAEVVEAADSAAEKLTEAVEQEAPKAEAAVETAVAEAGAVAGAAAGQVQEAAKQAGEEVSSAARQMGDKVEAKAEAFGQKAQSAPNVGTKPPKKKSKAGLFIAIVALVLVLLIGLLAVFAKGLGNFFKRTFSSAKSYQQYIEKREAKNFAADFADFYDAYIAISKKGYEKPSEGTVKVSIGEEAKTLYDETIGAYEDVDISWLENFSLDYKMAIGDEAYSVDASFALNDVHLLAMEMFVNPQSVYMLLPELSEEALYVDAESAGMNVMDITAVKEMYDAFPEGKKLENVMNRYTAILIDGIGSAKKSKEKVSASGISQSVYKLEAKYDAEDLEKVYEKMLDTAIEDEELKEIIVAVGDAAGKTSMVYPYGGMAYSSADGEDLYDSFIADLESAKENLSVDEDTELILTTWVDGSGKVIGRKVENIDSVTSRTQTYLMPRKGTKFGLLMESAVDEELVYTLEGEGKLSGGKVSGDFTMQSGYTEDSFNIQVEDFNYSAFKKGKIELKANFSMSVEDTEYLPLDPNALVIYLDVNTDGLETDGRLTLEYDEEMLAEMSVTSKELKKASVKEIEEGVDVQDQTAISAWASEADFSPLIEALREAGVPDEIVDPIEETIQYMQ